MEQPMTEVAVINRASLSQQIRDALLERIVSGNLKPGDRLIVDGEIVMADGRLTRIDEAA